MHTYVLKSPIVGIEDSPTGQHIIQIASGEIVTIPETEKKSGLVEIVCRGRNLAAFVQDLSERAERVEIAAPGREAVLRL